MSLGFCSNSNIPPHFSLNFPKQEIMLHNFRFGPWVWLGGSLLNGIHCKYHSFSTAATYWEKYEQRDQPIQIQTLYQYPLKWASNKPCSLQGGFRDRFIYPNQTWPRLRMISWGLNSLLRRVWSMRGLWARWEWKAYLVWERACDVLDYRDGIW